MCAHFQYTIQSYHGLCAVYLPNEYANKQAMNGDGNATAKHHFVKLRKQIEAMQSDHNRGWSRFLDRINVYLCVDITNTTTSTAANNS